ncbi:MAG: glycosyltransferase [Candidatus Dojkabacteria bacterium]
MLQKEPLAKKNFLLIHFRVGKTDGVSLEMDSWKKILQSKGANVALCSGPENIGADYVIEDLEQQFNPEMYRIDQDSFGKIENFSTKKELTESILKHQEIIEQEFVKVIEDFKPSNIIVSNIFSVGEGISVAGALTKVLDNYRIPTMIVNHDFYWENKNKRRPSCDIVKEQLNQYFPIDRGYTKNYCINKIAQEQLLKRKNIRSELLHDTFNFDQKEWKKKESINRYLKKKGIDENSIIILQATRVVRRKCIEIAIDFVKRLEERKSELEGFLYNGKYFDPKKDHFHLVLSGYVEKRDEKYLKSLIDHSKKSSIKMTYLGDDIQKEYDLFDIYPFADIVTYPSQYEGFGNQILEAIFAKKQIVLFEYPTFKTDIKNRNIRYISLGDRMYKNRKKELHSISQRRMDRAVSETITVLKNSEDYFRDTNNNFKIASRYFSYKKASSVLDSFIKYFDREIEEEILSQEFSYSSSLQI